MVFQLVSSQLELCLQIVDGIILHGCFLGVCSVEHSIVGVRSRLEYGVEFKYEAKTIYLNDARRGRIEQGYGDDGCRLLPNGIRDLFCAGREGNVPIGVGENNKIRNCIIDKIKNAEIRRNVIVANRDGVQEAERPNEGFHIISGITYSHNEACHSRRWKSHII